MYDIIGDIHGYAQTLELLLVKLGYEKLKGFYAHNQRKAIFLGDFIDRGARIYETLKLVRPMIDNGAALAVMGNHEYNAICFQTKSNDGKNWLRQRSQKNLNQHVATLGAFNDKHEEWKEYIEWFKGLPLFLDFGEFRVVHACWDDKIINYLKSRLIEQKMDTQFLLNSAKAGSVEFRAIETCLKGHEISLPNGLNYIDRDGTSRNKIRVKWWKTMKNETYRSISLSNDLNLPDIKVPYKQIQKLSSYPSDEVPVFIGHYWNSGAPELLSPSVCCVDYSIAKNEKLVAYRWNENQPLKVENFVVQQCIEGGN